MSSRHLRRPLPLKRRRPVLECLEERSLPDSGLQPALAAFDPLSATWFLRSSPSLKRSARASLAQAYDEALELVERSMPDAERPRWPDLPRTCPYAVEQVLDRQWWPERAGEPR